MLREETEKDSPLSVKASDALDKGEYLSEEVMAKLITNRINKPDC